MEFIKYPVGVLCAAVIEPVDSLSRVGEAFFYLRYLLRNATIFWLSLAYLFTFSKTCFTTAYT
ncbi:MAG: hypothetical protein CVU39_14275 [Chloroflexi bacterium HGW-Chloroflexi-10]|nr:MAG: hypothetical protein CVU39_14275 [Chloroflexi bacterium HGW-Chloroflexi-10]